MVEKIKAVVCQAARQEGVPGRVINGRTDRRQRQPTRADGLAEAVQRANDYLAAARPGVRGGRNHDG